MDPEPPKNKFLVWFLAGDMLLLNLGLGYVIYKSYLPRPLSKSGAVVNYVDQCGADCRAYIDSKQQPASAQPVSSPTPMTAPITALAPKPTKVRATTYLPLPGSGNTTANDWTNLAGTDFYFNPGDYQGLVELYLEASIHLTNGNGVAYFRLYDATHGIAVQGGDIQTSNQTSTAIVSGKVSFWAGKNLIRVQAKSLTADTAVFDSGRLRIVTEN